MDYKLKYIQFDNGTELISQVDFKDWENTNCIRLYDPYRLYPIPPFLSPEETNHQTLILVNWLPWTQDDYITVVLDKILVVADVSDRMKGYYESSIQRTTEEEIDREFREFGKVEGVPESSSDNSELEAVEGESLEELAELLTELTKSRKRVLH